MDYVGTRRKLLVLAASRMEKKREQTKPRHIVAKNLLTMSPGIYIFQSIMQMIARNGVQLVEETWKLQDDQIFEDDVIAQQRSSVNDNLTVSIMT